MKALCSPGDACPPENPTPYITLEWLMSIQNDPGPRPCPFFPSLVPFWRGSSKQRKNENRKRKEKVRVHINETNVGADSVWEGGKKSRSELF